MSVAAYTSNRRFQLTGLALVAALVVLAAGFVALDWPLDRIVTVAAISRAFHFATPIALAAVGGLYAEKSGVFNIGLEGFMIIGAISAAISMYYIGGGTDIGQGAVWAAILFTVVLSALLTALYAVLLIRYKADQIVAGLGVWFIGLGFAPFASRLVWGSVNSGRIETINFVPFPFADRGVSPLLLFTVVLVLLAWVFLYKTRYGYWVQAAGEDPKALDTAGVNVNRVRYATLIFSGVMAGLGGAVLLAHEGSWVGTGDTMTDSRGWIGIVAYLFGNYNPIGAALSALLFGGLDALNVQLQLVDAPAPGRLIGLLPYLGVVVVLAFWGKTRMPSAVGEPYEKEE